MTGKNFNGAPGVAADAFAGDAVVVGVVDAGFELATDFSPAGSKAGDGEVVESRGVAHGNAVSSHSAVRGVILCWKQSPHAEAGTGFGGIEGASELDFFFEAGAVLGYQQVDGDGDAAHDGDHEDRCGQADAALAAAQHTGGPRATPGRR